jgi:nickel-type superoxide dismutase maturation protease
MIGFFKVVDKSMEPKFKEGDYIITLPYIIGSPKKNDVVVLKHPENNRTILKRVGKINGDLYFVVGDNKKHSSDSRSFGTVKRGAIIGRVFLHSRCFG